MTNTDGWSNEDKEELDDYEPSTVDTRETVDNEDYGFSNN